MTLDNNDDFKFKDIDPKWWEEVTNQPLELNFSDADLTKLLEEANRPLLDISFDNEGIEKILEDLSSLDSELNFDFSEADAFTLIQDDKASSVEPELIPEPTLSITAKDVAVWMLKQLELKGRLYQRRAAWDIKRYFGKRFIYLNKNHNSAISRDVLEEFLYISLKTVVWNKREHYWRFRQPGDPINCRTVDD